MSRKGTIIFTGHFDIGETFSPEMKTSIERGKLIGGKPLILVGDIAVANKLITYIRRGLDGLILLYRIREFNCSSECVLFQLPKTEEEIRDRIDIEVFEFMSGVIKKDYPELFQQILSNTFLKKELNRILNDKILPILIEKRITEYGYSKEEIIVVREKFLRNVVTRRVNEKKIKNWTHLSKYYKNESGINLGREKIVSESGNPLCRGIMFAFYEEIWNLGYLNLYHIIESRHQQSIQKGIDLFLAHYKELGYLLPQEMNMRIITN